MKINIVLTFEVMVESVRFFPLKIFIFKKVRHNEFANLNRGFEKDLNESSVFT